ncbi:MAG: type IX secretion system membrane protein PorP/SprF [Bacteroidia bacterium]|jgi:type IX secretion system PorP/SprF family membrane protein|nr:type IX secretion system membrane protein PorP/SprF [Bacteroidia bacterium]
MRKIKTTIFLMMSVVASLHVQAQDPEFTQFYAAPVYTNPAMAGTGACGGGGRAVLNYRNQWPSLPGTFITTSASYDQHFDKIGGGVSLMILDDRAGEGLLRSQSVSAGYAFQLPVTRKFTMRFGIEGQYGQRSIDWERLRFEDQIDPSAGFVNPTSEPFVRDPVNYANFATGILGYTERFYAGVAVHNLIEPVQSFFSDPTAIIPRRYTVHSGVVIPLDGRRNPESTISPNVLFMLQNKFTQMNIGFYYNKGPLVTGLWFRQTFGDFTNSDALIALVGFRKDKFKFGYSFDLTVSDARSAAPVSHEISAGIEWCAKRPSRKYRKISCPDF